MMGMEYGLGARLSLSMRKSIGRIEAWNKAMGVWQVRNFLVK